MSTHDPFVSKQDSSSELSQSMAEYRASVLRHLLDGGLISLLIFSALPQEMQDSLWKAVIRIESFKSGSYVVLPTSADGEPLACSHELVSIWLERLDA